MSAEQTITQDNSKPKFAWTTPAWVLSSWSWLCQSVKTAIVLIFIINGVALGLFAFGLVNPERITAAIFGAISIAFSIVVLGIFVNSGVKFQSGNKRKR